MNARNGLPHLRIIDISDRELLAILADLEATEGYVDVHDVAATLWPRMMKDPDSGEAIHGRACVSRRLSWIRTEAGLVEKHETLGRMWRLTPRGDEYLAAKLRAGQVRAINDAEDDQLSEIAALLGDRYHKVDDESAWLLRREWQYRTARR